jgi:hypothetical protein
MSFNPFQGKDVFGSLGIAVKASNIWWSIQSLGETTDLTDQDGSGRINP